MDYEFKCWSCGLEFVAPIEIVKCKCGTILRYGEE